MFSYLLRQLKRGQSADSHGTARLATVHNEIATVRDSVGNAVSRAQVNAQDLSSQLENLGRIAKALALAGQSGLSSQLAEVAALLRRHDGQGVARLAASLEDAATRLRLADQVGQSNLANELAETQRILAAQRSGLLFLTEEINRVEEAASSARIAYVNSLMDVADLLGAAMSGNRELSSPAAEDLSIGDLGLNTAAPGTVVVWFQVDLLTGGDEPRLHWWFNEACDFSVDATFADAAPPSDPLVKKLETIDPGDDSVPEWLDEDPDFGLGKNLIAVVLPTNTGGSAASVVAGGVSGVRIEGLANMSADMVGENLTFSGAASGGNNGTFPIVAFVDDTTVEITNGAAVVPDGNNGSIVWDQRVYTVDDTIDIDIGLDAANDAARGWTVDGVTKAYTLVA